MIIGYSGVSALNQAAVYSVAYALDGQQDLIGPTLKNGVQTAVNNIVQGEISWIASYFPPRPPINGGATVAAPTAPVRAAASTPSIAATGSGEKPATTAKAVTPQAPTIANRVAEPLRRKPEPALAAAAIASDNTTQTAAVTPSHSGTRGGAKNTARAASSTKPTRAGRSASE